MGGKDPDLFRKQLVKNMRKYVNDKLCPVDRSPDWSEVEAMIVGEIKGFTKKVKDFLVLEQGF